MTTPTPTPDDHRQRAEELLTQVYRDAYAPMHPYRVDMLARATVHALLAQGPAPVPYMPAFSDVDAMDNAGRAMAEGMVAGLDAATEHAGSCTGGHEGGCPKPLPRKRAARKTTAPKETTK